jgi:S1-C subfamily serine protease
MKRTARIVAWLLFVLLLVLAVGWLWRRKEPDKAVVKDSPVPRITNVVAATPAAVEAPPDFVPPPSAKPREEIVGIGAILRKDETGALMITGTVPGSPAAAAGLSGNFVVRRVNGMAVDGLSLKECVDLMRGAPDTKVQLELFEPDVNETRTVELTRRRIQL